MTDHHDVCFVPYVQEAAKQGELVVFPGIEITCSDNVQCIAIFDPSCGEETFDKLINRLNDVMVAPMVEPKAHPVTPANMTILELVGAVADDIHLRENCVILPHFSVEGAYKSLNQDGFHRRFAELETNGVYTECPFSAIDVVTLEKI